LEDARRRQDISLFEDAENTQELPPSIPPTLVGDFGEPGPPAVGRRGGRSFTKSVSLGADSVFDYVGCVDFTLMPESGAQ